MSTGPCRVKVGKDFFDALLLKVEMKPSGMEALVRYASVMQPDEEAWLPVGQIYVQQWTWAPLEIVGAKISLGSEK